MATSLQIRRLVPPPKAEFVDRDGDVWVASGHDRHGELVLACPAPNDPQDAGEGESRAWTLHEVQQAFGPLIDRTSALTSVFYDPRLPARFWAKVEARPSGCWQWTARVDRYGYAQYFSESRSISGHRAAYRALCGPVPKALQLDHLCRNRACVNPAHLEPVTQLENARRGAPAQKTHCANGHAYTASNTYLRPQNGRRDCRACIRDRVRRYKSSKGSAA